MNKLLSIFFFRLFLIKLVNSLSLSTGPGGTPRPIELHSHDPLRYVGDMLAWLHQAAASEKEHLQTLLKRCECKYFSNRCEFVKLVW